MAPSKKQQKNAEYCKIYRQKHLDALRGKDKARKKFERDYRKHCQAGEKYEAYKKVDRERKANKKHEEQVVVLDGTPNSAMSSFKHKCTKVRSLKRAECALPNSPRKKKEIISSLASKFQLRIAMVQKKTPGPKRTDLTTAQIEWLVGFLIGNFNILLMQTKKSNYAIW